MAEHELPPPERWVPILDDPMRNQLLIPVPRDAFVRFLPDETRGGAPAILYEVFWITDPVFHLLRVNGFTADPDAADGVDDRTILSHRRISLEQVADLSFSLTSGDLGGTLELVGGEQVDVPVALLHSYLYGGPEGYGRPGSSLK